MGNHNSCLSQTLDIRGYVVSIRNGFSGATPGAAFMLVIGLMLIFIIVLPYWLALDVATTWDFGGRLTTTIAPFASEAEVRMSSFLTMSGASILATALVLGFTLLPTFFELVFPAFQHPLLGAALQASILFDFVTDWPKAFELTAGEGNVFLHYLYAIIACLVVSVGLQAILVMCITGVIYGAGSLLLRRQSL